MINYKFLQPKSDSGINFISYNFIDYDNIKSNKYNLVYKGNIDIDFKDINEICEYLFEKFNIYRPVDFKGYSMSVADILIISLDGKVHIMYCNNVGFVELEYTKFFMED